MSKLFVFAFLIFLATWKTCESLNCYFCFNRLEIYPNKGNVASKDKTFWADPPPIEPCGNNVTEWKTDECPDPSYLCYVVGIRVEHKGQDIDMVFRGCGPPDNCNVTIPDMEIYSCTSCSTDLCNDVE